jgi:hypothetical protein
LGFKEMPNARFLTPATSFQLTTSLCSPCLRIILRLRYAVCYGISFFQPLIFLDWL